MQNQKSTKRAFRSSVVAVAICVAMLIGTTFAWFTSTASTAVNKIESGNLKVELEYSYDMQEWETATNSTSIFDDNALWEPGYTKIVYLRVKNAGKLALKYSAGFTSNWGCSLGTNVNGDTYYITDYVKYGTAEVTAKFENREAAQAAIAANARYMNNVQPFDAEMPVLKAGETSNAFALVVYMPCEVGNAANPKPGTRGSYIYRLGVAVNATQAAVESDSFNNTYDEKAPTAFSADSASFGTHEITENVQANGAYGVVQAENTAKFIISADVYAIYGKNGNQHAAMAVKAGGSSKVIINSGDFRQVGVPENDPCDLIYATGNAVIEINGGTFKAATPANTLNCLDSDNNAKIIVNGGRFYKYDPSHPTLGEGEVYLGEGCTVIQDGDWFVVSK